MPSRIAELARHLEQAPTDAAALDELSGLLRASQDWMMLVTVLRMQADVAPDPGSRVRFLLDAAAICEIELSDLRAADELVTRVLEIDPASTAAVEARARLRAALA